MATTTADQISEFWSEQTGRRQELPREPLQNPTPFYLPGLTARPWWDTSATSWCGILEGAYREIRAEVEEMIDRGYLQTPPIAQIPPDKRVGDQRLIMNDIGGWELFRFYYNGESNPRNKALCPRTAEVVATIPRATGSIGFGVLHPGTRLAPHCGLSNSKLRIHLPLIVPGEAVLRVGGVARLWEEGRCVYFDDSYEHEVHHAGHATRYILMIDVHHPDLADREIPVVEMLFEMFRAKGNREVAADWLRSRDRTNP